MPLAELAQRLPNLVSELGRLERYGPAVLAQDPGHERPERRVGRLEHAVDHRARVGQRAVHPPGGVALHTDPGDPCARPDLPRPRDSVGLDVELRRQPEVALAPRGEADVGADSRDAERPRRIAVEVEADDVPDALVEAQRVRVDLPLGLAVAGGRPVAELDRALLRDRGLELGESRRELRRVVGRGDADALGRRRRRVPEAGPAEREVLEREAERLGVRELALERVKGGLEGGELVLVEVELVEEVVLRAKCVELLARELVPLRGEGHSQRSQLRAVGIEAAREGLVRHLRVTLDVSLDVTCRERAPLRHQERDERELTDQLVGVVRHPWEEPTAGPSLASTRDVPASSGSAGDGEDRISRAAYAARIAASVVRSRCWCEGQ